MNTQNLLSRGRTLGHTHAVYHVRGQGSVTVTLDDVPHDADTRFLRTGYPRYVNYNRQAYTPVVSGVTDSPNDWANGLSRFVNQ